MNFLGAVLGDFDPTGSSMGLKYSELPPRQTGELLNLFVSGSTARAAGEMVGVHRNTAALFFTKVRRLIAEYHELKMSEALDGPVEKIGRAHV